MNLAHYFGGCLGARGHSDVKLIRGFDAKPDAPAGRGKPLMIVPPGEKAPNVPNARDLFFTAALDEVKDCQVVVVCVDPPDTAACGKCKQELSENREDRIGVFCLQHGCKTFAELKGRAGEAPVILVDGAVGIHVVKSVVTDRWA